MPSVTPLPENEAEFLRALRYGALNSVDLRSGWPMARPRTVSPDPDGAVEVQFHPPNSDTFDDAGFPAVLGIVIVERSSRNEAVQRYGPNMVTDVLGILVTIIVVERVRTWQRERAAAAIRTVALRRVWYQLNRLTQMLVFAYKASAPPGSPKPTSVESLLEDWQREARNLDFRRPYLEVLGCEVSAAAEDLVDHPVFRSSNMVLSSSKWMPKRLYSASSKRPEQPRS